MTQCKWETKVLQLALLTIARVLSIDDCWMRIRYALKPSRAKMFCVSGSTVISNHSDSYRSQSLLIIKWSMFTWLSLTWRIGGCLRQKCSVPKRNIRPRKKIVQTLSRQYYQRYWTRVSTKFMPASCRCRPHALTASWFDPNDWSGGCPNHRAGDFRWENAQFLLQALYVALRDLFEI